MDAVYNLEVYGIFILKQKAAIGDKEEKQAVIQYFSNFSWMKKQCRSSVF